MAKGENNNKNTNKNINTNGFITSVQNMANYVNDSIKALNQSKIFAGIMIVIINIASKFVTFTVSKTVESYLKFTFSRHMLVFAATWLGTRDIYISALMTVLFIVIVDVLFNEKSMFCCLPQSFVEHQVSKLEGMENKTPSAEEIVKAKIVLEKAKVNYGEKILHDSNQIPLDILPIDY
jgi:hypothetical protein